MADSDGEEDKSPLAGLASSINEEEREAQALVLAARFSQAVCDLQYVGVCRPSKKRKGSAATMQKTYYPPASLLGGV